MMKAIQISPKVWWVGAIDWQLKEFHGYTTRRGSTYNAFLVMDERITLIDTVKAPFLAEMMERIASVVDPARIDVIVSNHAEMDHSGSLPETVRRVNPSAVYASTLGVKALEAHFHDLAGKITPVKSGDAIELGATSLKFVETRMLHWPDSMFSYLTGDNVLFSQDGFGMHYAVAERGREPRWPLELLRGSQAPRRAECGTRGSLRTMHGGGSDPSQIRD